MNVRQIVKILDRIADREDLSRAPPHQLAAKAGGFSPVSPDYVERRPVYTGQASGLQQGRAWPGGTDNHTSWVVDQGFPQGRGRTLLPIQYRLRLPTKPVLQILALRIERTDGDDLLWLESVQKAFEVRARPGGIEQHHTRMAAGGDGRREGDDILRGEVTAQEDHPLLLGLRGTTRKKPISRGGRSWTGKPRQAQAQAEEGQKKKRASHWLSHVGNLGIRDGRRPHETRPRQEGKQPLAVMPDDAMALLRQAGKFARRFRLALDFSERREIPASCSALADPANTRERNTIYRVAPL
jgi:hypothetical protein